MNKMHDHITDGPDEDTERERNAYPQEEEYDKYVEQDFALWRDADEYYERCQRRELSLELRISMAIEQIVKRNSFDHRDLIQLLKDCKRRIEGG